MKTEQQDQTHACQDAIMAALIGFPMQVVFSSLTCVLGAMIGQYAASPQQARKGCKTVTESLRLMVEDSIKEH